MDGKQGLFDDLVKAAEKEFGATVSHASIEDLLKRLSLKRKEHRTEEEDRELERLQSLPVNPELRLRLEELANKNART